MRVQRGNSLWKLILHSKNSKVKPKVSSVNILVYWKHKIYLVQFVYTSLFIFTPPHFWVSTTFSKLCRKLPMDAKKMMARKSRIGSIQDIISSVTIWPWEEIRAPAKKHPSSIETSSSSVICQGITGKSITVLLPRVTFFTISHRNYKAIHCTGCSKII